MKQSTLAVCVTIIAALIIATCGCVNNASNQSATQSAAQSAAQHAFLEKFLTAYKNWWFSDHYFYIFAWKLTWTNSTSANLEYTATSAASGETNNVETYTVFPTSQDATNYLNSMNLTSYSLTGTLINSSESAGPGILAEVYLNVTGHNPQVFYQYTWNENPRDVYAKYHEVLQYDNLIITWTWKKL